MSHFISSMPAAGLIEMPPLSKHTPLPTSATGGASAAPPLPAHDRDPRLARAALRDPEQRPHAELAQLRRAEDLDLEADRVAELAALVGEALRREHVGRLGDQVAGMADALGPPPRRPPRRPLAASGSASRKVSRATSPVGSSSGVFWVWYLSNR